ncbi:MAG: PD-(D/E)XK nuclease family protein [Treponema sp.]|nr:PD-(D/E)XK nuclease family protein [Treponema sp.]
MNPIEETLKKYILDHQVRFVFGTQIEATLWADKALEVTEAQAVETERFLAWDDFKGTAVKCRNQDKKSVPGLLRKVFAAKLIEENAHSPFFSSIITREFASCADGFRDWLASVLPSLKSWKEKFDESMKSGTYIPDSEDQDYLELYGRYSAFLDEHDLFDPAWERPPFVSDGNRYVIFYPETLMDWSEYSLLLESAETIELVHIPQEEIPAEINYYENVRVELREAALKLRKIHAEKNIPWTEMALSVPDLENYEPYITREFDQLQIPYNARMGLKLGTTGAGKLFRQILDCHTTKNSYESVKGLLKNLNLPWGKEQIAIDNLLDFGRDNNCLYSYTYDGKEHDIWQDSFADRKDKSVPMDEATVNIYKALKKHIDRICTSDSFEKIKTAYGEFKGAFFDMKEFSEESNRIVSRCVKELDSLIDLEVQYPDARIANPFAFFVSHIEGTGYVAQNSTPGVHIYSYRSASCAPFKFHAVIDASQDSISVEKLYKNISFINDSKREKLGLRDFDPTVSFIKMYAASNEEFFFSCAEKKLGGYSFPHGYFKWKEMRPKELEKKGEKPVLEYDILAAHENEFQDITAQSHADSYEHEKAPAGENAETCILEKTRNQFDAWKDFQTSIDEDQPSLLLDSGKIQELVKNSLYDPRDNFIKIDKSRLQDFYTCPRLFFMKYVMGNLPLSDEAQLTDQYTEGNLKHRILELYLRKLKDAGRKIAVTDMGLTEEYMAYFEKAVEEAVSGYEASSITKELFKTNIPGIRQSSLEAVIEFSRTFGSYEVFALENDLWLNYRPEPGDYKFIGRADCILKIPESNNEEAEYVIVDYKGTLKAEYRLSEEEGILEDFQMPLYVRTLQNMGYNVTGFAYFSYRDLKLKCTYGAIRDLVTGESIEPKLSKNCTLTVEQATKLTFKNFDAYTQDYVEHVRNLDFCLQPDKSLSDYDGCRSCTNYRALCRKFFTVSGRD